MTTGIKKKLTINNIDQSRACDLSIATPVVNCHKISSDTCKVIFPMASSFFIVFLGLEAQVGNIPL